MITLNPRPQCRNASFRKITASFVLALIALFCANVTSAFAATVAWDGTSSNVPTVANGDIIDISSANGKAGGGTLTVPAGATVTITGTASVTGKLTLSIGAGARVTWQASLTGNGSADLVELAGTGLFEVAAGALLRHTGGSNCVLSSISSGNNPIQVKITDGEVRHDGTGDAINLIDFESSIAMSGGKVFAGTGYAMRVNGYSYVFISGGLVYANGTSVIGSVISATESHVTVINPAAVIARNTSYSNYVAGSSDGLSVLPSNVSATWTMTPSNGINYMSHENAGFFAVSGVTIASADMSGLKVNGSDSYNSVATAQTAINNALIAGTLVTVTGGLNTGTTVMNITIPTGKQLVWKAVVQSSASGITLSGDGEFVMDEGGSVTTSSTSSSNYALQVTGANAKLTVADGTIASTAAARAISVTSAATVDVKGGYVESQSGYAIYSSSSGSMITVDGGTVRTFATSSSYSAIFTPGSVEVKSGAVSANTGSAIESTGASATVKVSGGTVTNQATSGSYPAINMSSTSSTATSLVTVSGTGKVRAEAGGGYAISTYGSVKVEGDAEVSATTDRAINASGASSAVTVSGGAVSATTGTAIYATGSSSAVTVSGGVVSATTGRAIYATGASATVTVSGGEVTNQATNASYPVINMSSNPPTAANLVTVSGTGKVRAEANNGRAIETFGSVKVEGNAEVSATTGYAIYIRGTDIVSAVTVSGGIVSATTGTAIYTTGTSRTLTVSGGVVFAYNSNVSNIIYSGNSSYTGPTNTGVVIAWNKTGAGANPTYNTGATTNLTYAPNPGATVVWAVENSNAGISYTNSTNTGFIPVAGVTVNAGTLTAPAAPGNFTATAGDAQVTLNWTTPGNGGSAITKYQYSYGATAGYSANWVDIPSSGEATTAYTVTGLTNGTGYTFEVRAVNSVGNGATSGTQTATPIAAATAPTAPGNFTATAGDAQVVLNWTTPSNGGSAITKYQYSYGATAVYSVSWIDMPSSGAATTTHTVTGLTNGTGYTFEVRAVNAIGNGATSGTQTATPAAANVCKINETGTAYATLDDAVAAVQNGETITLLRDVALSANLELDVEKTYTLDLGGKTISNGEALGNIILAVAGTITIQNGEIVNTNTIGLDVDGCTVTLSGLDIQATNSVGRAVSAYGGATVSILSGNYYGGDDAVCAGESGTAVTIISGHFESIDSYGDGCLRTRDDATITLAAGSVADVQNWLNGAKDVTVTAMYGAPVAKIGSTLYYYLQDAVDAVQNGETITLLRDVELSQMLKLNVDKTYTLDLGGYKISNEVMSYEVYMLIYASKGTVTIQNGKIENTADIGGIGLGVDDCTVTLSGLDLWAVNYGVDLSTNLSEEAKIFILSGNYYGGEDAVHTSGSGTTVTIASGHFLCDGDDYFPGCLATAYDGTITLAPGSVADVQNWLNGAKDVTVMLAIEAALKDLKNETYRIAQANGNDIPAVKLWLVNLLNAKFGNMYGLQTRSAALETIIADLEITALTPAVAGTAGDPDGTDGSFKFNIELAQGSISLNTGELSGTIIATRHGASKSLELISLGSLKIRIINTGALPTGELTLELTDPAGVFSMTETTVNSLPAGGNADVTLAFKGDVSLRAATRAATDVYTAMLTVHADGIAPVSISITYSPGSITGMEDAQAKQLKAYVRNGQLHVEGLTAGKVWSIYNITGVLVRQSIAAGDEADINLSASGIYILKSGNNTIKIIY